MSDETQPNAGTASEITTETPTAPRPKRRQGFATMTQEQRSAIARLGGRAVQFAGTGHRWNAETGSAAGKLSSKQDRRKKNANTVKGETP